MSLFLLSVTWIQLQHEAIYSICVWNSSTLLLMKFKKGRWTTDTLIASYLSLQETSSVNIHKAYTEIYVNNWQVKTVMHACFVMHHVCQSHSSHQNFLTMKVLDFLSLKSSYFDSNLPPSDSDHFCQSHQ